MRILGLTDNVLDKELMDKGIKETFPEAEVCYLAWPPATGDVISKENQNIEKNGPEAGIPVPGIIETIIRFDPEVIVTHFAPVTRTIIEKASSLEIIGCLRGGFWNVDVEAATRKNILVFNNPGRNSNAVAELTIGLMLAVSRNIGKGYHTLLNGVWWRPEVIPSELYGSIVGLVGFGNIARKVTERLYGFKVNILGYDPYVAEDVLMQYGVKRVELKELLRKSDFVCLHSRLSAETRNLIGEAEFKLMKPTAYLINTARAGLIDKEALLKALQKQQILGAALDVFWQEPLSEDDPLIKLSNVILTPHLAGITIQTHWRTISFFTDSLRDFLITHRSGSIINFDSSEQINIASNMKLRYRL